MKSTIKNKISFFIWVVIAIAVSGLFIAAMQVKRNELCPNFVISINSQNQADFITKNEVSEIINANGNVENISIKKINIALLEKIIERNPWVENAELYFENNGTLHVDIDQRKAIARMFTVNGSSYYLDKNGLRLPIKNDANTRVLLITNFPSDNTKLSISDSILLNDVSRLSNFIATDSFWNAQIAQVDITTSGKFEIIPTIGDQTILFGDINEMDKKFDKLFTFYKSSWQQNFINMYSTLDLRFLNQVVAKRKGKNIIVKDTLNNILNNNNSLLSRY